jgi:hypothetical protein
VKSRGTRERYVVVVVKVVNDEKTRNDSAVTANKKAISPLYLFMNEMQNIHSDWLHGLAPMNC